MTGVLIVISAVAWAVLGAWMASEAQAYISHRDRRGIAMAVLVGSALGALAGLGVVWALHWIWGG